MNRLLDPEIRRGEEDVKLFAEGAPTQLQN